MLAAGQFGHHAFRVHTAGQHVTVVAVAGDYLITLLDGHLHPDDDRLLPNIQVAKAPNQAHAVELAGLFLEAADEQHTAVGPQFLLLVEIGHLNRLLRRPRRGGGLSRWFVAGNGHFSLETWMV